MTDLGRLELQLGANDSELRRRLRDVERYARESGQQAGFSFKNAILDGIGKQIGANITNTFLGSITGSFRKLQGFIKDSLQVYQGFSSSINSFGVFAEATEEQIKAVTVEAQRLGAQTSKSAVDVAQMTVNLAKMGFGAEQVKNSLSGIVAAAEATGEEVEQAGEVIGVALNNFGQQFTKTEEDINKIADLVAVAANSSALDLYKINLGLATAGGTAAGFNQTLEDTLKILGLLADNGVRAEAAATATKNIIVGLANPSTEKAKEAIKQLGIEVRNAEGELRSIYKLLPELIIAFNQLNPQQRGQFAQDIFGREAMSAFLQLLNVTDEKFAQINEKYENFQGQAQRSTEALQKGIAQSVEALGGSVDTLKLRFAEAFAPGVEASTRYFQSIIDGITANKDLFDDLTKSTKEFTDLLSKNPKLAKELSNIFMELIQEGLESATDLAEEFITHLEHHPELIGQSIEAAKELASAFITVGTAIAKMTTLLADAVPTVVTLAEKLAKVVQLTAETANNVAVALRPREATAEEFGIAPEAFRQRFDLLGSRNLVDTNRNANSNNPNDSITGVDQLVQDTITQLLEEKNRLGQVLTVTQEELDKRVNEIAAKTPLFKRPTLNLTDLRRQAFEELRKEKEQQILDEKRQKELIEGADQGLRAAAKRQKESEKPEPEKPKEQSTPTPSAQSEPQKTPEQLAEEAKQAQEAIEAQIELSLQRIATAELQRNLDIDKLVQSGAITYEQAEIKKLNSAKQRIEAEIKAEQEKVELYKDDPTRVIDLEKARQGVINKTIELLKNQQQTEETLRNQAITKLREETSLSQQKIEQTSQAIELQKAELSNYDEQINRLELINSSLERQRSLTEAQNSLEDTISKSRSQRSDIQLERLNRAKSLTSQLEGADPQQRGRITGELRRLGFSGRIQEEDIVKKIGAEERKQFRLKADALKQQQEAERKSLEYERQKTELQIQQSKIAADRAVKEAEFNREQSLLENESQQLGIQAKIQEAKLNDNNKLARIYEEQLRLVERQQSVIDRRSNQAIASAKDGQNAVVAEGLTQLEILGIRERELGINQRGQRNRLEADYDSLRSSQRLSGDIRGADRLFGNERRQGFITSQLKGAQLDGVPDGINANQPFIYLKRPDGSDLILNSAQFKQAGINDARGGSVGNSPFNTRLSELTQGTPEGIERLTSVFPQTKPVESQFQDRVIGEMAKILEAIKQNASITQNNDYSLNGTNEAEILRKAQQQNLTDLVDVFKGVRGQF